MAIAYLIDIIYNGLTSVISYYQDSYEIQPNPVEIRLKSTRKFFIPLYVSVNITLCPTVSISIFAYMFVCNIFEYGPLVHTLHNDFDCNLRSVCIINLGNMHNIPQLMQKNWCLLAWFWFISSSVTSGVTSLAFRVRINTEVHVYE